MTERIDATRARWRRLLASTRSRVEVVAVALVLILFGAVAFTVVPAVANDEKRIGEPVPADVVPEIVAAALSCPSLNPSRLAAQIMAASRFSEGGAYGNIGALDPAAWERWRPESAALITDHGAVVAAVGHRTCNLAGQLRAGGLTGDLWSGALAAEHAGVAAVLKAKDVPEALEKRVDATVAYARWYAGQFAGTEPVAARNVSAPEVETLPAPAPLIPAIRLAGGICPAITPVRIAAQLRVLSRFDANLRSPDGANGIAQFTPEMWRSYRRSDTSVWDPQDAIVSMGAAMCALSKELALLDRGDPYVLALGAYQWGPDVVRRAGGLPSTTVPHLADRVMAQMAEYEKDARLTAPAKKDERAGAKDGKGVVKPSKPAGAPNRAKKAKKSATRLRDNQPFVKSNLTGGSAFGPYFMVNYRTTLCARNAGTVAGQQGVVDQALCVKANNQEWEFVPRVSDKHGYQLYWIRNNAEGCVDPPGTGSVGNDTPLVLNVCRDQDNQYFRLEPTVSSRGYQYYWLRNTASGMCFEVPGAGDAGVDVQLQMVPCLKNDDHDWALLERDEW